MNTIDVSVIMSVWDKDNAVYLEESFESIEFQSVKASEFILIQDGPINKKLLDVIDKFKKKLNLKIIESPKNIGLAESLNIGLRHANHKLIIRMDSDDKCHPKRFEKLYFFMKNNKKISVCGSWITRFNEKKELGIYKKIRDENSILRACKYRNPIAHPTVIMNKKHLAAVGYYPQLTRCQDWGLWSMLLKNGFKITNLQEPLLYYRVTDLHKKRKIKYLLEELKVIKFQYKIKFLNFFEFIISSIFRIFFRIPYIFLHTIEGIILRHK